MLSTAFIPRSPRPGRPRAAAGPAALAVLVCALFFVSGLGQTALVPLLPRLAGRLGLGPSGAALVLALPGMAMLSVSLPVGILADRVGARRVTLGAAALLALGCALQGCPGLAPLVIGRLVYGVGFGALWTAGAAWLSAPRPGGRAGPSRVGTAVVCSSVGTMVGPALGGALGHGTAIALPFGLIAAASSLVGLALVAMTTAPADGPRPAPARRPGGGLAGHARDRRVAAGIGSIVVAGALAGVTQLLIAEGLHADGLSAGRIGVAFSACALGYIAVSVVFTRLGARAHTLPVNAIVTGLGALALVPALAGTGPTVLIGALLLTAAPRGAINVIAYGLAASGLARAGRADATGAVFGLLNGAWAAATVLTPLAAGALTQGGDTRAGYLVVIVPALLITGLLVAALRPGRARRDPEPCPAG
jgi:MFS family permease